MIYVFSLSIAPKVFYNNYFEISESLLKLYKYNKLKKVNNSLFHIKDMAIVTLDEKIIGHTDPLHHPLYTHFDSSNYTKKMSWNKNHTILYTRTPLYYAQELIAYIYISVDPLLLIQQENLLLEDLYLLSALILSFMVLASLLLSKMVNRPMEEILKELQNIGTGNIALPLTKKRKDEFAILSKAIISADKHIANQHKELINHQSHLENTVLSRTEELNKQRAQLITSLEDLKKYQNKLIEAEKMSSLGSLVAGVAHEINTPLGVSITGITFIESETKKILQAMKNESLGKNALSEYLEVVSKMSASLHLSLMSAARLVRSFKQVAIDQHVEDKRHIVLYNYFEEVLLSLHNKLKYENIEIINAIDKDIKIFSYAGIFSQIFTNFIMNSIIHAFEKDKKDKKIMVKSWRDKEFLYLTYEDNGKGIQDENLTKIFDPFFTTALGKGGSGLGLNIVYNLISHKLHGEIECSNQKEGIMISITIPCKELEYE